jgi:hypothetical protein
MELSTIILCRLAFLCHIAASRAGRIRPLASEDGEPENLSETRRRSER